MPGRFRFVLLAIGLAGVFLAGCIYTLGPLQSLDLHGLGHAHQVAVAVAPNGTRNIAFTECDSAPPGEAGTCYVVFERRQLTTLLFRRVFSTTTFIHHRDPDVAVTDTGDAYLVWRICSKACEDHYTVIPADATSATSTPVMELDPDEELSFDRPRVETNGTHVYALYFVGPASASGSVVEGLAPRSLRYRQLLGGTAEGFVEQRLGYTPTDVDAAVDVTGTLHVAWHVAVGTGEQIAYASGFNDTDDLLPITQDSVTDQADGLGLPKITAGQPGQIYFAWAAREVGVTNLFIKCEAANLAHCHAGTPNYTAALTDVATGWSVLGLDIGVTGNGNQPYVAFAGRHDGTDSWDIFTWSPPSSGTSGPLTRTHDLVNDSAPIIAIENSDQGPVPVLAWRQYTLPLANSVEAVEGVPACYGDVYYYAGTLVGVQLARSSAEVCANQSFDLGANGEYVGGVFIAPVGGNLAGGSLYQAWTAFNAHTAHLPYVQR